MRILPLTPSRWNDFVELFGARGACGGCWCMWPRRARAEYERGKGEGNRRAMRRLVQSGRVPGLIAYAAGEPVGWIAIEPRERFVRLRTSRVLAPIDAEPVWSIPCFFVRKDWRGRGLSRALIDAAASWARKCGARIVEAYPNAPRKNPLPAAFAWQGLLPAFLRCGFTEVARRSRSRPIVRLTVRAQRR
jgi:GNAT superfamily N-acetyltransferase